MACSYGSSRCRNLIQLVGKQFALRIGFHQIAGPMHAGAIGANGLEAEAMHQRRAVLAESPLMIGRGVALIGGEIVLRKDFVPFGDERVAMFFGKDRSGGNRAAASVAID